MVVWTCRAYMQLISKVADIHRVYQDDENRVNDHMDVRYSCRRDLARFHRPSMTLGCRLIGQLDSKLLSIKDRAQTELTVTLDL